MVFSKESEETGSWIPVGRLAPTWQRILQSSKSKRLRKPYNEGNDFSQWRLLHKNILFFFYVYTNLVFAAWYEKLVCGCRERVGWEVEQNYQYISTSHLKPGNMLTKSLSKKVWGFPRGRYSWHFLITVEKKYPARNHIREEELYLAYSLKRWNQAWWGTMTQKQETVTLHLQKGRQELWILCLISFLFFIQFGVLINKTVSPYLGWAFLPQFT